MHILLIALALLVIGASGTMAQTIEFQCGAAASQQGLRGGTPQRKAFIDRCVAQKKSQALPKNQKDDRTRQKESKESKDQRRPVQPGKGQNKDDRNRATSQITKPRPGNPPKGKGK